MRAPIPVQGRLGSNLGPLTTPIKPGMRGPQGHMQGQVFLRGFQTDDGEGARLPRAASQERRALALRTAEGPVPRGGRRPALQGWAQAPEGSPGPWAGLQATWL